MHCSACSTTLAGALVPVAARDNTVSIGPNNGCANTRVRCHNHTARYPSHPNLGQFEHHGIFRSELDVHCRGTESCQLRTRHAPPHRAITRPTTSVSYIDFSVRVGQALCQDHLGTWSDCLCSTQQQVASHAAHSSLAWAPSARVPLPRLTANLSKCGAQWMPITSTSNSSRYMEVSRCATSPCTIESESIICPNRMPARAAPCCRPRGTRAARASLCRPCRPVVPARVRAHMQCTRVRAALVVHHDEEYPN